MPDDWFRPVRWTTQASADFEARLGRARRRSRQQYLYVAGASLRSNGDPGQAQVLWLRALADRDSAGFFDADIREGLGDLAAAAGDLVAAEEQYRTVLASGSAVIGTSGAVELSLAEVLLADESRDRSAEAEMLVRRWDRQVGSAMDHQRFRARMIELALAERRGDHDEVRRVALEALDLLARCPVFPRHPGVGLAVADQATTARLRRLADPDVATG